MVDSEAFNVYQSCCCFYACDYGSQSSKLSTHMIFIEPLDHLYKVNSIIFLLIKWMKLRLTDIQNKTKKPQKNISQVCRVREAII